MRPIDNMEKAVKKLNFTASTKLHDRILDDVLDAQEERKKNKSASAGPNIGRTNMKKQIGKIAAAAAIVTAVVGGIYMLESTSVAIGQVKAAMERVKWMRVISEGSDSEMWLGFKAKIIIVKENDGAVTYTDFGQNQDFQYIPDTQTITVSKIPKQIYELGQKGPLGMLENPLGVLDDIRKVVEADGGQITNSRGKYEGSEVAIWKFSHKEPECYSLDANGKLVQVPREEYGDETITIFIDTKKHLPLGITTKFVKDGKLLRELHTKLEYPETGPKNIYDLGVPTSATIVDKTQQLK
ncbi:MAG: hypothetical protein GWN67_06455 [Phycisphaerae bacterium]|nr:hypothetical protein [Phycisphaerae bacterium]NIP51603.1 hypothetical protein [Phycisphaerae bacterium]NIS50748.1 hypothetical protein [Phycisphaerae bacterium]NIU08499.1 hypothetical protein [Phycisphaerae bacterium]NIU56028.1 hypothetical protein [Phycisphaerae bacterium]